MRVTVTARDIKNGTACDSSRCPVSRALRRALRSRSVYVAGSFYYVGNDTAKHPLPKRANEFVWAFDTGGVVEPFSFVTRRPV